ncbi:MAG: glutamate synthase subunit alpha, partial [Verrucomicrobiota bacterium]
MVGQSDKLEMRGAIDHWKANGLDFSMILHKPDAPSHVGIYCTEKQDHGLDKALDNKLIELAQPAIQNGEKVEEEIKILNINRTLGTMLSYHISKKYGEEGLPEDTIVFNCHGSAGQSFAAFGARGLTFNILGDANDYFGKGLSGAKLIVRPPDGSTFVPEENIIAGNVALFGAVKGEAYIRGLAGERFCVRNSGAWTVVEGIGDHGCEYMTGGRAVILGPTGRNFAAGMSGGIAYILDEEGGFLEHRLNHDMVDVEEMDQPDDIAELREMIEKHVRYTDSSVGRRILDNWEASYPRFIKIMPTDYKKALAILAREKEEQEAPSGS